MERAEEQEQRTDLWRGERSRAVGKAGVGRDLNPLAPTKLSPLSNASQVLEFDAPVAAQLGHCDRSKATMMTRAHITLAHHPISFSYQIEDKRPYRHCSAPSTADVSCAMMRYRPLSGRFVVPVLSGSHDGRIGMVAKQDFTDRFLKSIKAAPKGKRALGHYDAQVQGSGVQRARQKALRPTLVASF